MYYIVTYFACLAYAALAAISPQATIVPNTWHELARFAVILTLAFLCVRVGQLFRVDEHGHLFLVRIPQERDSANGHPR